MPDPKVGRLLVKITPYGVGKRTMRTLSPGWYEPTEWRARLSSKRASSYVQPQLRSAKQKAGLCQHGAGGAVE